MDNLDVRCFYCGQPVNPLDRQTWRRIVGWERKTQGPTRRGGSDIALREPRDEYAHPVCVRRMQTGLHSQQGVLL